MKISVIGGGRWARTIASVLHALPGRKDRITLHSPSNFAGVQAWANERPPGARLRVERAWPTFQADDRPDAMVLKS